MTGRAALAEAFLAQTTWANSVRATLAGDASNRRYERLTDPKTGATAVLMDAPPEKGEDVRPFITIAEHLQSLGLSAPRVFARDAERGFLVLEDLGDDLFSRVLVRDPGLERTVYEAATDVLIHLHGSPLPRLDAYDPPLMAELAGLALSKYAATVDPDYSDKSHATFVARFEDLLRAETQARPVLIQRDYHAENLLWLPDRDGVARVGLLDFQDAMSGHPAYDLVSLLQDARRDVPAGIEMTMLSRYIARARVDDHAFRTAYAVLGAQRALRILGVFARLCTDAGKPHYVDLIPRVWDHLVRNLEHPVLAPIAETLLRALPPPTTDALNRLKDRCKTVPTP